MIIQITKKTIIAGVIQVVRMSTTATGIVITIMCQRMINTIKEMLSLLSTIDKTADILTDKLVLSKKGGNTTIGLVTFLTYCEFTLRIHD